MQPKLTLSNHNIVCLAKRFCHAEFISASQLILKRFRNEFGMTISFNTYYSYVLTTTTLLVFFATTTWTWIVTSNFWCGSNNSNAFSSAFCCHRRRCGTSHCGTSIKSPISIVLSIHLALSSNSALICFIT